MRTVESLWLGAAAAFTAGIYAAGIMEHKGGSDPGMWLAALGGIVGTMILCSWRGWCRPGGRQALALACLACVGGWTASVQVALWHQDVKTLSSLGTIRVWGTLRGTPNRWRIRPKLICSAQRASLCIGGRALPELWWKGNVVADPAKPIALSALGQFVALERPGNAGEYDPVAEAVRKGVAGELRVSSWHPQEARMSLLATLGANWGALFGQYLTGDVAVLVRGMVLGGAATLSPAAKTALQRAGLAHITSVSGLHVALVAGFAGFISGGYRGWIGLLASAAFVLISGAEPPAVRALVALIIAAIGQRRCGRADPWKGLLIAWMVLLFFNPQLLHDAGFQLSFASVAGILAVGRPLLRQPQTNKAAHRIGCYVYNSLVISISAQAGAAYTTAQVFGTFSLVGPLANLAGAPLASLVLLLGLTGSALCALGMLGSTYWSHLEIIQVFGATAIQLAGTCAEWLLALSNLLAGVRWAVVEIPALPGLAAVAWCAVLIYLSLQFQSRRLPPVLRNLGATAWLLAALLAVAGCLVIWLPASRQLRITFFDVGQGDAILVQSPSGAAVLVDAGGRGISWDASRVIVPQLRRMGIRSLYAVVSTHPHADHLGGMAGVIAARPTQWVLDSGISYQSGVYAGYLQALHSRHVQMRLAHAGDVLQLGPVEIMVLWPPTGHNSSLCGSDPNKCSVVLRISYMEVSVLLTADATNEVQRALLAQKAPVQAVLWKVPHQGAAGNFNSGFIAKVAPQVSVISVGRNKFGHPSPFVVQELQQQGVLCRTDQDGAVELVTDGVHWRVRSMRGSRCRAAGATESHASAVVR